MTQQKIDEAERRRARELQVQTERDQDVPFEKVPGSFTFIHNNFIHVAQVFRRRIAHVMQLVPALLAGLSLCHVLVTQAFFSSATLTVEVIDGRKMSEV